MVINKQKLVEILHSQFPHHERRDLSSICDIILESIRETLSEGGRVEIRGLGTFQVKEQKQKEFLNPKTGKPTKSKKSRKIYFRPSSKFLEDEPTKDNF